MNKWTIVVAIIMVVVIAGVLTACNRYDYIEKEILALALAELEIEDNGASIEFICKENVGWIEYDCETYILKTAGTAYLVGVQRKGTNIHYVDVVEEL